MEKNTKAEIMAEFNELVARTKSIIGRLDELRSIKKATVGMFGDFINTSAIDADIKALEIEDDAALDRMDELDDMLEAVVSSK